ncbi:MAG: fibrobacter succinogenes major paralogous domain-containing protein [Peptostreptococcaceae bacterium]|nr:fibrobacter succinogenes major paralogous domain-containing protein [Peptostreptococcaceae bacterium]
MAKIKYGPAVTPLTKKHYGYTFLNSSIGKSMAAGQRNNRTRYPNQSLRQQNLQKCIREWRNMSATTVANWDAFAAAYQQPTKRNSAIFLSGYQLFLKRNHYCFLNHGIDTDFLDAPAMEAIAAPEPVFTLKSGNNIVDVTEQYIHNFGILPAPGDSLLFWAVPYSDSSGQFFPPIKSVLVCEEVFIDGLFLNLVIPNGNQNITYSVYLSKPVHAGSNYGGTKIRYMGCFTTKSFLGLTDTPGSYAGQAGKQVSVKADETGLEFAAGGGGGLTCETLAECPVTISTLEQILILQSFISGNLNTSIPPVKFGLFYNGYCVPRTDISSDDNWRLSTKTEITALMAFLGGANVAGGHMKIPDLAYWLAISAGADNSSGFNGKGSSGRNSTGSFNALKNFMMFWTSTPYFSNGYNVYSVFDNSDILYLPGAGLFRQGASIRLVNSNTLLAEGEKGIYRGNNNIIYRTIVINGIEIIADNLAETFFRDGSPIPEVQDSAVWRYLTTPALCAYNNDWANV